MLDKLSLLQILHFATEKCGIRNMGSSSKLVIRRAIAAKLKFTVGNAPATKSATTHDSDPSGFEFTNSLYRAVNVVFHPDFYLEFVGMNDMKSRKDFETGAGANDERLWTRMADAFNDKHNKDLDAFLPCEGGSKFQYEELYRQRIFAGVKQKGYNPGQFLPITAKSLNKIITVLLKVRS